MATHIRMMHCYQYTSLGRSTRVFALGTLRYLSRYSNVDSEAAALWSDSTDRRGRQTVSTSSIPSPPAGGLFDLRDVRLFAVDWRFTMSVTTLTVDRMNRVWLGPQSCRPLKEDASHYHYDNHVYASTQKTANRVVFGFLVRYSLLRHDKYL
ncbi:hypothetical protein T440DRAFT_253923 [Plenodomus tracheiphilus IPT5]|uniref:Uncharacterized protein n=1 Tax=Plenodomus tracheiphilus IPT5 TaxID=1408161 RepID=A0A6A7ASU7_9PLEO|nr:hypothetical protein T440DRAFT_253923 [Plenodomus tracheiphilus IPT5]